MIHWFDLFVIFFLLASAAWSYFRGLIKEAFSIASLFAGIAAGAAYYEKAAPMLGWLAREQIVREVAAFAALFVISAAAVAVIGILIRRALHISKAVSFADHAAGLFMGLIKGAMILVFITFPLAVIPSLSDEVVKGSKTAPALAAAGGWMIAKLAPDLARGIEAQGKKGKETGTGLGKAENYIKKLNEIEKKAAGLRDKIGLGEKESGDDITEDEKKKLDELIEQADKNRR